MSESRERLIALYGTDEPLPQAEPLSAGPLTAELFAGQLRMIRFTGIEVLRGIAFLYRDRDWQTPVAVLGPVSIDRRADGLTAAWDGRVEHDGGVFAFRASLEMGPRRLRFAIDGRAETALVANRIGFIVLHPASVAGKALTVCHIDGGVEMLAFPTCISPHQPALAIRSHADASTSFWVRSQACLRRRAGGNAWP
ncbi:hypothetical protein BH10PSE9_BH10PSE9_25740 [soil metagenome]